MLLKHGYWPGWEDKKYYDYHYHTTTALPLSGRAGPSGFGRK